jgi:hypothetical protein
MSLPTLTPAAELVMLRTKYPDGLWCTSPEPCEHRLLATTAAGWSKSWAGLPEPERLAHRDSYVCAECRHEAAERARVTASKVERARVAAAASVAARKSRTETDPYPDTVAKLDPSQHPHKQRAKRGGFISLGSRRPKDQGAHGARGGRPRKHANARAARAAAQQAYRERKKQERLKAADALLIALAKPAA